MACEDYPCCGHEAGDCPTRDSRGREVWRCTECRKPLPRNAAGSICARCIRDARKRFDQTGEMWHDTPSDY